MSKPRATRRPPSARGTRFSDLVNILAVILPTTFQVMHKFHCFKNHVIWGHFRIWYLITFFKLITLNLAWAWCISRLNFPCFVEFPKCVFLANWYTLGPDRHSYKLNACLRIRGTRRGLVPWATAPSDFGEKCVETCTLLDIYSVVMGTYETSPEIYTLLWFISPWCRPFVILLGWVSYTSISTTCIFLMFVIPSFILLYLCCA